MNVFIENLLKQQAFLLDQFFAGQDVKSLQQLVDLISRSSGSIYLLGVGKSGAIARKLASTFVSTGTKAHYLSATDALHGDIGNLGHGDIALFLSKSGESDELLALLPHLKQRGADLAAMTMDEKSRLASAVDLVIALPFSRELGPHEMIPTTSCICQLIIGDIVALSVMQTKGITLEQFALNHPAGQLGKRLTLRVENLMLTGDQIPISEAHEPLHQGLLTLTRKRCGCLIIANAQKELLGILTDGDLRRHLQQLGPSALERPLAELMNVSPRTISPKVGAYQALLEMESGDPVMEMPVVKADKLVGLLKMHDLLRSGL